MSGESERTFLFTDIVGSSRLWNRARAAMSVAVERHDTLLRTIVAAHNGTVFKTGGDAVYAVFTQPNDALRAGVEAQRALLNEAWAGFDTGDTLRVRMAIHTGTAEARGGDYFGPPLNRLSRTLNASHGGQILCTYDTMIACGERWPAEIERRDLGERTLRDVPGSGHIFQLVAEGLPEHFPPLATLDPRTHNLPNWVSPLVGRETEQARIRALVRSNQTRLMTVLGTGGVGKTRLAVEAVSPLLDEFQHGIRFVDLSPLRDDAQVIPTIVHVTGAADQLLDPREALLEWLRPRELLLLLDNCEQVVEGVASICSDILNDAPGVTIVATSRVPIRIRGERQLSLDPFLLPADERADSEHPAVRLFAERAIEVRADFALDPASTTVVTDICRMVDGLPLAIELAAAWVRILSPEALHRRLQESRAMLRDGARDLPDRQRALATTIAWSYDLLDTEDQRAFRRLAVFRGGIALDAAAAVLWDGRERDSLWALRRLDALVQANLLQTTTDPTGEPRFVMLQTIQEFATDVLRSSGEWDEPSSAHADYFARLALEAKSHYGLEEGGIWLDRLDPEIANFGAAIEFSAAVPERRENGLRLVVSLRGFLSQRGYIEQSRQWLNATFDENASHSPELIVDALVMLGNSWHSDPEVAERYYRQALLAADAANSPELRMRPAAALTSIAVLWGNYETAIAMAQEVADFGRVSARVEYEAMGYLYLAHVTSEAGQFERSLQVGQLARSLAQAMGDADGEAWGWLIEGRTFVRLQDPDAALPALERALTWFADLQDESALGVCHLDYGLAVLDSDRALAQEHIAFALTSCRESMDAYSVIRALEAGARLLIGSGHNPEGCELLGTSQRLRAQTRIVSSLRDADPLRRAGEMAADAIGMEASEIAIARGGVLSPRAAIDRFFQWVKLLPSNAPESRTEKDSRS